MKIKRTKTAVEIVFDDPTSKNSFSLEHAERWLKAITGEPTDLLVMRSEGSVFCSGGNLADYAAMTSKNQGIESNQKIRHCLELIDQVPCLKVAFVSGDCYGGGIEVLSVCHKIYSLNHVFFGLWQSRMHLSFGWGGLERLARRVPVTDLQLWLSEGRTHSAYWCAERGLVDEILTDQQLCKRYGDLLSVVGDSRSRYLSTEILEDEAAFFEKLWWSDEHRKALKKFKP